MPDMYAVVDTEFGTLVSYGISGNEVFEEKIIAEQVADEYEQYVAVKLEPI